MQPTCNDTRGYSGSWAAVRLGKDGKEAPHGEEGDSASPQLPREGRLPLIEMEVPPQLWSTEHGAYYKIFLVRWCQWGWSMNGESQGQPQGEPQGEPERVGGTGSNRRERCHHLCFGFKSTRRQANPQISY